MFVIAFIALAFNSATKPNMITTVVAMSLLPNKNSNKVPTIDQWKVSPKDGTLTGIVTGHPVLEDGDEITTSPLTNPYFAEVGEGTIVTTVSGTKYKLETPNKNKNNNHKQSSFEGFVQNENIRKKAGEPIIDDWKIDPSNGRLTGIVTGHPVLPDGDFISASPPIENGFTEGSIVTTETGNRYKLKAPRKENGAVAPLFRKPQPPTLEITQQEMDDQMAKLDGVVAETTEKGSDSSSGGIMLGVVAAAGIAGVVGLNAVNDPNSMINTNVNNNNNANSYSNKIIVENKSNRGIAQILSSSTQQQNKKLATNDDERADAEMTRVEKGQLKEKEETARKAIEKAKQEREQRQIKLQELFQERERARIRLETAENTKKEAEQKVAANEKTKAELQQRQEELDSLQKQRQQQKQSLRLEAAENAKKEAERKVAANEKAKAALQQQQEELESLRKQRQQQQQSLLLQQQAKQEELTKAADKSSVSSPSKEKPEEQEAIEKVYEQAKEAKALSKELEERMKSEERSSMLETIQTGVKGIALAGFTGAAGLVGSFEIRRRISEETVEKISDVSESIDTTIKTLGESTEKQKASRPPSRRPPSKASVATNITDKLKFVDEIDDLLAEVEDVLAEVDVNTIEKAPTILTTDASSQISSEPIPVYFTNDTVTSQGDPMKKSLIGENYFRSQIISSDNSSLQEEYVVDPSETRLEGGKQESKSSSDFIKIQADGRRKENVEEEELAKAEETSRLQAEEEARIKKEEAAQMKIEELIRLEELARLEAEVEEAEEEMRIKVDEEARILVEEAARLEAEEEARIHAEEARFEAEEEAKMKAEEEARLQVEEEARIKGEEKAFQFEDDARNNFELKMKEESLLEKVRRNLLGVRLKEQKDAYEMILEERMMAERDLIAEELKIAEEKKKQMMEKQAALRAEKNKHDLLLYKARRTLLEERMKEQRLSFELELERKKITLQQKEEDRKSVV